MDLKLNRMKMKNHIMLLLACMIVTALPSCDRIGQNEGEEDIEWKSASYSFISSGSSISISDGGTSTEYVIKEGQYIDMSIRVLGDDGENEPFVVDDSLEGQFSIKTKLLYSNNKWMILVDGKVVSSPSDSITIGVLDSNCSVSFSLSMKDGEWVHLKDVVVDFEEGEQKVDITVI